MTDSLFSRKDLIELDQLVATFKTRGDIGKLINPGDIGVELGVAEGSFSERLLTLSPLGYLYSIDAWAGERNHGSEEYKKALRRLAPHKERNAVLRLFFNEALDLFENDFFDFIYVDGYAHTGEEGGQTYRDWFPKLKSGGIFAGDDYDPKWPLVIEQVDRFVQERGLKLFIINCREQGDRFSLSPSWFVIKP